MAAKRLLAAGLVLLLTAAGGLLFLGTPPGARWLERTLSARISREPGFAVTLHGITFAWPATLRVAGLEVQDADGTWCTAAGLAIETAPGSLFRGPLRIRRLALDGLEMNRRPSGLGRGRMTLDFTRLGAWRIDEAVLEQARFNEGVVGKPMEINGLSAVLQGQGKAVNLEGRGSLVLGKTAPADIGLHLQARAGDMSGGLEARLAGGSVGRHELPPSVLALQADVRGEAFRLGAAWTVGGKGVVRISANGPFSNLVFTVAADGRPVMPFAGSAAGRIGLSRDGQDVVIEQMEIAGEGMRAALSTPAQARFDREGWRLEPAGFVFNEAGRIEVQTALEDGRWTAEVEANNLPLNSLPGFDALSVTGLVTTARLRGSGTLQSPKLEWSAGPIDVRSSARRLETLPETVVSLTGGYAQDLLHAAVSVTNPSLGSLTARAELPVRLSFRPLAASAAGGGMSGAEVQADLRLDLLNELGWFAEHLVGGQLLLDLVYDKSTGWRAQGPSRIENGRYEHAVYGTSIRDIQADLVPQGRRLVVEEMEAVDEGGGRYAGRMEIDLEDITKPSLALQVALTNAAVLNSDMLTAKGDGRLEVLWRPGQLEMQGRFDVASADVQLDRLPPARTRTLPVIERGGPEDAAPAPRPRRVPPRVTGTLEVNIPGALRVRGAGLESIWAGNLTVSAADGTAALSGELTAIRGAVNFLGRRFELMDGRLFFRGGGSRVPTLDVNAEHVRGGLTARLRLTGPLNSPAFDLTSTPAYPDDEILARILFGRGRETMTPAQAAQLAFAVHSLRERQRDQGWNLAGRLKDAVGIDLVEIREEGEAESEAELVLGKYTQKGAYIEYSETLGKGGQNRLRIEKDLGRHFTVETDIGSDVGPGIGLNWRFDY